MEFLERQLEVEKFELIPTYVPTGITSLSRLIREYIDMNIAFAVYPPDSVNPMVFHTGGYRGIVMSPVVLERGVSDAGDTSIERAYILDPDKKTPKIIQVPVESVPTALQTYGVAMRTFYTRQSVQDLLVGLRNEGWQEYDSHQDEYSLMGFVPISNIQDNTW